MADSRASASTESVNLASAGASPGRLACPLHSDSQLGPTEQGCPCRGPWHLPEELRPTWGLPSWMLPPARKALPRGSLAPVMGLDSVGLSGPDWGGEGQIGGCQGLHPTAGLGSPERKVQGEGDLKLTLSSWGRVRTQVGGGEGGQRTARQGEKKGLRLQCSSHIQPNQPGSQLV